MRLDDYEYIRLLFDEIEQSIKKLDVGREGTYWLKERIIEIVKNKHNRFVKMCIKGIKE